MSASDSVVVVGAGMVGHRFVEELVRRDASGRFEVHLVGAEQYEPYNRILLTEVLAGRASLNSLALSQVPDRVRVCRGASVVAVDREARQVEVDGGERIGYDRLVLATGADAFVPPIAGLEQQPRHVHVLRDLDDTRAVRARSENARHAVVLGGGVLGLEAACGLAARGVAVTVVQNEPQLMAGQLDDAPAAVLRLTLADLGVRVRLGCSVAEVISAYGELVAVRLTDETVMAADMMLVSCGARPRTALAAAAGLPVQRGIVVGPDLTSPEDGLVHAIGDCAQPPQGTSGLLAPGWAQAERLAEALVSTSSTVSAAAPVAEPHIRLKAVGIDLAVLGVRSSTAAPEDRVISVSDPRGHRHVELVARGDRLVGATCLGAPAVAAELSVLVERGTPLPQDPLALLTPERRNEETTPVRMPAATTVCRCNNVTKQDLLEAWDQGACSVDAMAASTRATTGCGGCTQVVCGIVDWLASCDPNSSSQPLRPKVAP